MSQNNIGTKATVFSGISSCTSEMLAYMIALMKHQTTYGTMKDQVHTISTKVMKFFGKGNNSASEYKSVNDKIQMEIADLLSKHDQKALVDIFKAELAVYMGMRNCAEWAISDAVINKAASAQKEIPDYFSVDQKADAIYNITNVGIAKNMANLTDEENKKLEDILSKEIEKLPPDKRLALEKTFNAREITATMLRKSLMRSGLSVGLFTLGSGFGSYIFLTTIIHAVFTTLLGITLPFSVYMGATSTLSTALGPVGWLGMAAVMTYQGFKVNRKVKAMVLSIIVYIAIISYGKSFVLGKDGEPLWITSDSNEYKEYKEQEALINDLRAKISNLDIQNDALAKDEANEKETLDEIESKLQATQEQLDKALAQVRELEKNNTNTAEIERLKREQSSLKKEVEKTKKEKDNAKKRLSDIQAQLKAHKSERERYENEINKFKSANERLLADNVELKRVVEKDRATVRVFGMKDKSIFNFQVRLAVEAGIKNTKEEIAFKTPFMNVGTLKRNIGGRPSLLDLMEDALGRGVVIKINYGLGGHSSSSNSRDEKAEQAIALIKKRFKKYLGTQLRIVRDDDHSKVIIIDKKYMASGSFNFFSNYGDFSESGGETMNLIGDMASVNLNYEEFFDFEKLTKNSKSRVSYDEEL